MDLTNYKMILDAACLGENDEKVNKNRKQNFDSL